MTATRVVVVARKKSLARKQTQTQEVVVEEVGEGERARKVATAVVAVVLEGGAAEVRASAPATGVRDDSNLSTSYTRTNTLLPIHALT